MAFLIASYASPDFSVRKNTWDKLSYFFDFIYVHWLVIVDFNAIPNSNENFGGNSPIKLKINTFNAFLNKTGLLDLGYI